MENQIKPKSLDNLTNEQVDGKNVKGGNGPMVGDQPIVSSVAPDPGNPMANPTGTFSANPLQSGGPVMTGPEENWDTDHGGVGGENGLNSDNPSTPHTLQPPAK